MKPGLQRIEATLHQLPRVDTTSYPKLAALRNHTYSFEIGGAMQKHSSLHRLSDASYPTSSEDTLLPSNSEPQASPTQQSAQKEPTLPRLNPRPSHDHNSSHPTLKEKLAETQIDVATYKAQLQQIVQQIQETYLEGPLVDGWLESYPHNSKPSQESVHLANYIEEVCSFEQGKVTCESPRLGYRLCGLDASGQKWSRPCPPEQLPSISIAIARYQKLRQLLKRKHQLEAYLSND